MKLENMLSEKSRYKNIVWFHLYGKSIAAEDKLMTACRCDEAGMGSNCLWVQCFFEEWANVSRLDSGDRYTALQIH